MEDDKSVFKILADDPMERGPPSLVRVIDKLVYWEVADLIKKVDI